MPSFKAIETAAEIMAPAGEKLAAAARCLLGESALASVGESGAAERLLSKRRFLRYDAGAAELEAIPPDIDWQMRKSELSQTIARRINEPRLTAQQFFQAEQAFAQPDRPLVHRLLEYSAGNASEIGLMRTLDALAGKLQERFPSELNHSQLFAASASSPGNMLAYLYRKSLASGQSTLHFDYSGAAIRRGTLPAAVFDDLSYLGDAERKALLHIQDRRPVVAVDVNGFERTVNFIDFSRGQPAVLAKLDALANQTKGLIRQEPGLKQEDAIKRVLYREFDRSVQSVNRQAPAGTKPITIVRGEALSPLSAFEPALTPQQVESFLEEQFNDSSAARIMAAEVLAEDVEFHTLGGMIPRLKNLQEALRVSATRWGTLPEDDLFVVAAENCKASSDAFMTYLYKEATGLPEKQVVTLKQLQAMRTEGLLEEKRIVAIDDAIYNGWNAEKLLEGELAPFRRVTLATLSSFQRFARRMHDGDVVDEADRQLVHLQTDFSLGPAPNVGVTGFYKYRTPLERALLNDLAPPGGLQELSSLKVFPHMASDTTPWWLTRFAQQFPLTFEHVALSK